MNMVVVMRSYPLAIKSLSATYEQGPVRPEEGSDMTGIEEGLLMIGYWCRPIANTIRIRVSGHGDWVVCVAAKPITAEGASQLTPEADLEIEVTPEGLRELAAGKDLAETAGMGAISIQGRASGGVVGLARSGAKILGLYDALVELIPSERLWFMNNGFLDARDAGDSVVAEDWILWRNAINMVEHAIFGVDVLDKDILDIGAGRGGTCAYLALHRGPRSVCGVDFCQGNVDYCVQTHSASGATFTHGNAMDLPFDDAKFDVVTNLESSHGYPSAYRFVEEVRRVLRSGGALCWADSLTLDAFSAFRTAVTASGGHIVRTCVITEQVLRSMRQSRRSLFEFWRGLTVRSPNSSWIVDAYCTDFDRIISDYESGTLEYYSLQATWI
jgi:ubiquinone/menaquinone biosynthesis C-methylase UbiE